MATLELTYSDIYTKVSEYLGLGSPTTDATELVTVKNIVKRGYRRFLMPTDASTAVTIGKQKIPAKPYSWSFLRQTTTLSTVAGTETYQLPVGFNGMIIPPKHTTPQTLNPVQVPLEVIYQKKSETTGNSYPLYFAIKDGDFNKIVGRRMEIVFNPPPDAAYTYYYTYRFIPEAPVEDGDYFVGPIGSSEAILECALAVAELQEKDTLGVHNDEAERLVQRLIGDDKISSLVGNIGGMIKDSSIVRTSTIYDDDGNQLIPA